MAPSPWDPDLPVLSSAPLLVLIGQEKEQKMYLQTIYERGRAGKWLNTGINNHIPTLSFQKSSFQKKET